MNEQHNPSAIPIQTDKLPSAELHPSGQYETLENQRKQYVLEKSLRTATRFANELHKQADAADVYESLASGFATDESKPVYIRDYLPLVQEGLFIVQGESEYAVSVRPVPTDDVELQIELAKEILNRQPFRQQLRVLADSIKDATEKAATAGQVTLQTTLTAQSDCIPYLDQLSNDLEYPVRTQISEDGFVEIVIDFQEADDNEETLFLHSRTAQKLIQALTAAGCELDQRLMRELVQESDHRYGNAYAWISRELVKGISGYPSSLWSTETPLTTIQPTGDAGADLIIDIANQLALRQTGSDAHSDIPATMHGVELRDKGCKDAEEYFIQSASIGKLFQVTINEKRFWHKTHGGRTYINLDPITYKGIELPPGFVFKQSDVDGSYALLRATAFVFDEARGDHLFGVPYSQSSTDSTFLYEKTRLFQAFTAQ